MAQMCPCSSYCCMSGVQGIIYYVPIVGVLLSLECTTHLRSSSLSVAEEADIKPQKNSVIR